MIELKDLKIEIIDNGFIGRQYIDNCNVGIRIIHIPTGIAVECDSERDQLRNKNRCMRILEEIIWVKRYGK